MLVHYERMVQTMNITSDKTTRKRKLTTGLLLLMLLAALGMQPGFAAAAELTMDDAKVIALEHAGLTEAEVFITTLKTDYDDGRKELEVEFVAGDTEYEYEIDAEDGSILKASTEKAGAKKSSIDPSLYIGFDMAVELALADAEFVAADVTITGLEFDFDDGRAEYEVEFVADGTEYQYEMDAATGEVYGWEAEKVKGGRK